MNDINKVLDAIPDEVKEAIKQQAIETVTKKLEDKPLIKSGTVQGGILIIIAGIAGGLTGAIPVVEAIGMVGAGYSLIRQRMATKRLIEGQ